MKMDEGIDSNVAVLAILDNQSLFVFINSRRPKLFNKAASPYKPNLTITTYNHQLNQEEVETNETSKQNIIWTKDSTLMLLNLYETKLNMLDNPKKKSKMWISMSEELKAFHIEVTPDQVRWKINALTKKYKDCLDSGQGAVAFKYFNEMHQILGRYNEDGAYRLASGIMQGDKEHNRINRKLSFKNTSPYRKLKTEHRTKVELDKQWIEYLQRQEEQRLIRDERYERSLRLREEELELKKKELENKQTIALKKLQLKEKKHEEILKIEQEKCALLRKLLENQ